MRKQASKRRAGSLRVALEEWSQLKVLRCRIVCCSSVNLLLTAQRTPLSQNKKTVTELALSLKQRFLSPCVYGVVACQAHGAGGHECHQS